MYKNYNPDLRGMTDDEALRHYLVYGQREHRIYGLDLPADFDPFVYQERNPDLRGMDPWLACSHFVMHGRAENRAYRDPHFDRAYFAATYGRDATRRDLYNDYAADITQEKNPYFADRVASMVIPSGRLILLVNHDARMFGASLALLTLADILRENTGYTVVLIHNQPVNDEMSYDDDPTLLYLMIRRLDPVLVYFNSINYAMSRVIPLISPRILHSHEIQRHYQYFMPPDIVPDLVVSEKISRQYDPHLPAVVPPFLTHCHDILEKSVLPIDDLILNAWGVMDQTRLTVAMCGEVCPRKNYALFERVAQDFPNYNFLWIGNDSLSSAFQNVYHIPYNTNPYRYFRQIVDVFILFSLEDPCPIVILENILLETTTITFSQNIFYHHDDPLLRGFYREVDGAVGLDSCREALLGISPVKRDRALLSGDGARYLIPRFCDPSFFLAFLEKKITARQ